MRLTIKLSFIGTTIALLLAGCNMPSSTPNAAATLQAVYTQQAATVQALQTQARITLTPTPSAGFPTLPAQTSVASITPIVASTAIPSLTPLPSPILPSRTPAATSTPFKYCNWAAFVDDVTIPDGTVISAGAQFTKIWRLKNIGTCAWTTSYGLVFLKGDNMGAAANTHLPDRVDPGDTVDVSLTLVAPSSPGSYRGYWLLRSKSGELFGLGESASDPFYIDIKVSGPMTSVFKFTANYCDAVWRTSSQVLDCPGDTSSIKGYVIKVENPQLENGKYFDGPALLMSPQKINDGYIRGIFPAFDVQTGDHFRSIINCAYQAKACDAVFKLDYQIGNGPIKTLWSYSEVYDGLYRQVDADLSSLAGNSVKFILTVLADGPADGDNVFWVGPRIDRPSTQSSSQLSSSQ